MVHDHLHRVVELVWEEPKVVTFCLGDDSWGSGLELRAGVSYMIIVDDDALLLDDVGSFARTAPSPKKEEDSLNTG